MAAASIVGPRKLAERDGDRRERTPVVHRRPKAVERREVFRNAVAHVPFEAVAGMGGAEAGHQTVARYLGDDGSRRDRRHEAVAADHGLTVAAGIDAVAAVDEHQPRPLRQRGHGPRQRP